MEVLFGILAILGFVGGVASLAMFHTARLRQDLEIDKLRRDLSAELEQSLETVKIQAAQDVIQFINDKEDNMPTGGLGMGNFRNLV